MNTCEICKTDFTPRGTGQLYCGNKCAQKAAYARQKRRRQNSLTSLPITYFRYCKFCSVPFSTKFGHAKYCSKKCQETIRRRRKDARRRLLKRALIGQVAKCSVCEETYYETFEKCSSILRKTALCDSCVQLFATVRLLQTHLRWRKTIAAKCRSTHAMLEKQYARLNAKKDWELVGRRTSCPFCQAINRFTSCRESCAGCGRKYRYLSRKIHLECMKRDDPDWYFRYRAARNAEDLVRRRGPKTPFDISKRELQKMRIKAKKCAICGENLPKNSNLRHVDHIWLRSRNGTNTRDNLRVTCSACNLSRPRDHTDIVGFQLNIFMEVA